MSWRKNAGVLAAAAVFVTGLVFGWQGAANLDTVPAYNPDNLIRLHVVAHSDSLPDQALKYRVRDAVVDAMTTRLVDVKDVYEAREIVQANLAYINEVAVAEVRAGGFEYPVEVMTGQFQFPARTYAPSLADQDGAQSLFLPQGEYEALRVVIGDGVGANWWCVLFPPLCFARTGQTGEVEPVCSGPTKTELRFRVLEVWRNYIKPEQHEKRAQSVPLAHAFQCDTP